MSENKKIIIREMNANLSDYDYLYPKAQNENYLIVTSLPGTTITLSKTTSQSYTFGSGETTHSFNLNDGYGDYAVKASKDGFSPTYTFSNTFVGLHEIEAYPYSKTLDSNSWNLISIASSDNIGQSLWSIGDKKSVTINGKINGYSYNTTLYVFIIDFAHNINIEGTGICFQGFKDASGKDVALCAENYRQLNSQNGFVINPSGATTGGWNGSYMKQTVIPQFKNTLPSDLRNNIKITTIWSHNAERTASNDNVSNVTSTQEEIYLAAEFEVFGVRTFANSYEQNYQTQYQYYKNGNSKIKYRDTSTSSNVYWWLRSVSCFATYNGLFCECNINGQCEYDSVTYSSGFAPVFKI